MRLDLKQLSRVVRMAQEHREVAEPDEAEDLAVSHVCAWLEHKERLAKKRQSARGRCPNCGHRGRNHSCIDHP